MLIKNDLLIPIKDIKLTEEDYIRIGKKVQDVVNGMKEDAMFDILTRVEEDTACLCLVKIMNEYLELDLINP